MNLVFFNGFPYFSCHNCLDHLLLSGERTKEAYRAMPNRLLPGALAGLAGMVIGSILWAVITVLFDRIGAIYASAIMAGIVKIMDWRQTKRSIWSVLIAAVYAMGAVIIGTYLAVLWYGYQKLGMPSSVDFFWRMWRVMWQAPEIRNLALFIGGIGVILAIWQVLSNQKRALSRYFKPHIEIIKPKEV